MPDLDATSLAVVATLALLLTAALWLRRRGAAPRRPDATALDTVEAWPPQAVRVMTLQERQAFELLKRALPRRMVLAQVPLSRFISVPTENSYGEWLQRVGRLSADFIVCDSSSRVVAAVDVRTEAASSRSSERHQRVALVLERAGIPVHVWNASALPTLTEIRTLFRAGSEIERERDSFAASGVGGLHDLPLPDMVELIEEGDERALHAPLHDPVSSGFFDDLEAIEQPIARAA